MKGRKACFFPETDCVALVRLLRRGYDCAFSKPVSWDLDDLVHIGVVLVLNPCHCHPLPLPNVEVTPWPLRSGSKQLLRLEVKVEGPDGGPALRAPLTGAIGGRFKMLSVTMLAPLYGGLVGRCPWSFVWRPPLCAAFSSCDWSPRTTWEC